MINLCFSEYLNYNQFNYYLFNKMIKNKPK